MFESELKKNWKDNWTIFDFAAFCYEYLCFNIEDEAKFLGIYIFENVEASKSNVNIATFNGFVKDLEKIFENGNTLYGIRYVKDRIDKLLLKFQAKLKGKKEFIDEQLAFYILKAIDMFVDKQNWDYTDKMPLNNIYKSHCYIYLNTCTNMIAEAAKELEFLGIISEETIRKQLFHLNIFEKAEIPKVSLMEAPKIQSLFIAEDDKRRKEIVQKKKFNIAVIPFGQHEMITFPVIEGARFKIEYNEWHKSHGKTWALNLLEKAIDEGANIILFPEFICSVEIQEAIGERLKELYMNDSARVRDLFLVVAGSGWTADNNNVARFYSYSGMLLGKHYKYGTYSKLSDSKKMLVEGLENRGKETTIVEIPGMGRCMIGICKDISERSYIQKLAEIFCPQFLFVPAWSPSIRNGFEEQFREIIAYNHMTSCVLCNCCAALDSEEFKTTNNIVVTPYKDKSLIVGKKEDIKRTEKVCTEDCKKGGCIYMLCLNYCTENVKNGKIVENRRHIL